MLISGVEVPARLLGVITWINGAIYFFLLLLVSHIIRVLLEIQQRLDRPGASSG